MTASDRAIVLDLRVLTEQSALDHSKLEDIAKAATVVLERLHGPSARDLAAVAVGDDARAAEIVRVPIDPVVRATWNDPQEATEWGAVAVALTVARQVLDRVVFLRLPKGTGADYLMHDPRAADGDRDERLECSGIGDGSETTRRRLNEKIAQLAKYPELPPGRAIVTNFRSLPVEIMIGTYP